MTFAKYYSIKIIVLGPNIYYKLLMGKYVNNFSIFLTPSLLKQFKGLIADLSFSKLSFN